MTDKIEQFEENLAELVGDPIAFQIGYRLRAGQQQFAQQGASFKQMLAEYLTHELDLVPTKTELANFGQQVESLAADLADLSNKIQQFSK